MNVNKKAIFFCGDGRYRAYVGGSFGYAIPGSWTTYREAEIELDAYITEHE